MIAFGSNVAVSYVIFTINRSADNLLVGWYWGAGPLGLYSRAYNLLMLPVRQLSAPASSIAIPAFSRIQNDPERFARYYLRAVNIILWISAPIFGFLFVAAEPVIVLVLGTQWRQAAPVFQILAISALVQLFLESTIWLFVSRGQSDQLLKLLFIICPVIVSSFVIGLPFGIKGVALFGSLVLVIILPWILKFTFRGTNLTLQRVGQALMYPISVSFVGVVFAELATHLMIPQGLFWQLLIAALGFGAAYPLSLLITPVRKEIVSFGKLFSDFRLSNQTV